MKRALYFTVLAVVVLIAGGMINWFARQIDTSNSMGSLQIASQPAGPPTPNLNIPILTEANPTPRVMAIDWEQYYEAGQLYKLVGDDVQEIIQAPFIVEEYYKRITPYGVLYWKIGPTKTAISTDKLPNSGQIEYEDGIDPAFIWYDFTVKQYFQLPDLDLANTGRLYDRVYAVHFSSTEPKLLIEIGNYDTQSIQFQPGMYEAQPYQTHGIVYDITSNELNQNFDPLKTYLSVLSATSTLGIGFRWDSQNEIAVAVPSGEGCTAATLTFVNLSKQTKDTVGGWGSYDFIEGDYCNPASDVSPDGRWLILEGMKTGGTREGILFNTKYGSTPVKRVSNNGNNQGLESKKWDLTKEYPIYGTGDGEYDFN